MNRPASIVFSFVLSFAAACSSPSPGGDDAASDVRGDTIVPSDTRDSMDVATIDAVDAPSTDVTSATDASDTATTPDVRDVTGPDVSSMPDVSSDVTSQPDVADVSTVDVPATGGSCGGRGGRTCASGEFCNYALADICGRADATGTCTPVPTVCPDVVMPVCGCDGMDYSNECEANRAGVSVSTMGMCPMADCRTSGCPSGRYCTLCFVSYACIPVGAVC